MKIITANTVLLLLFLTNFTFAQSSDFDSRLLDGFSQEEINKMDSETLEFNTYCIEHAYFISEAPTDKKPEVSTFESIEITDQENINFWSLNVMLSDKNQYFKILNSNKILTIKPKSEILKELK